MTLPELVATDLDGTLVDSEGQLSVRTRDVLDRLDAAGVPLVVVTARPLRWMTELWPVVGRHGVGIVSNGAIVYDVAEDRIHELEGIEVEAGLALIAAIRAALPEAVFAFERRVGVRARAGVRRAAPHPGGQPVRAGRGGAVRGRRQGAGQGARHRPGEAPRRGGGGGG